MIRYFIQKNKWIILILGIAFFLRLVGITYGLPLWVVSDEPPFVYGALEMIKLHNPIPAMNPEQFIQKLYFPPFLSYLFLPFFSLVLIIWYFAVNVPIDTFQLIVSSNPSIFFIIARLLSVCAGTITVWFIYKAGKNIFKNEAQAVLSAAFLALSLLHTNFSHWGRHWSFIACLIAAIIYVLSIEKWNSSRRYIFSALLAGIAFGINYQGGLAVLLIGCWFFINETGTFRQRLRDIPKLFVPALLMLSIATLAIVLYPQNLSIVSNSDITKFYPEGRSILGFLEGYTYYGWNLMIGEPVLLLFAFVGAVVGVVRRSRFVLSALLFSFLYIAAFYVFFFHLDRYILGIMPIIVLLAGNGAYLFWEQAQRNARPVVVIILSALICSMFLIVLRFDYLLLRGDTRTQAIGWVEKNVLSGTKIISLARLARFPSSKEAIAEQEKIDPSSLRSVDRAEALFPPNMLSEPRYHALNLGTVKSPELFAHFSEYIRKEKYEYIIYGEAFAEMRNVNIPRGEEIVRFPGYDKENDFTDITNGYAGGWYRLLTLKNAGPTVVITKLQ